MVSPHLKGHGHEVNVAGSHIDCIYQIPKPLPSGITEKKHLQQALQITSKKQISSHNWPTTKGDDTWTAEKSIDLLG